MNRTGGRKKEKDEEKRSWEEDQQNPETVSTNSAQLKGQFVLQKQRSTCFEHDKDYRYLFYSLKGATCVTLPMVLLSVAGL